jgi:hypothetical protein
MKLRWNFDITARFVQWCTVYTGTGMLSLADTGIYIQPIPVLLLFILYSRQICCSARSVVGMHRISGRPDNPAFFYIRYPAGYQIGWPVIRLMYSWSNDFLIFFFK